MKRFLKILLISFASLAFSLNINLNHLEFLRDEFNLNGRKVVGYWIYAEKRGNEYERVGAKGEGVTCVDDVARVAVLYLDLFELMKKDIYASRAKEALEFVIAMQDKDGDFYNFLEANGEVNRTGPTSRKSGNWWAVRALWAMAKGARVLKNVYPNFSKDLLERSRLTVSVLKEHVNKGLLHGHSSISSIFILGLSELYRTTGEREYLNLISALANEVVKLQIEEGPFKGFISDSIDEFTWHGWGSRYLEALVEAYRLTGNALFLNSAKLYADSVGMFMLILGPVYSVGEGIKLYPQLSYAAECGVSGLVELYKVTKDRKYALMAALMAGFLFGNNVLKQSMLGPNGEGYDGLHSVYINRNAGAESTICALRILVKTAELGSEYEPYVRAERVSAWGYEVLEAEKMDTGISNFSVDMSNGVYLVTSESLRLKYRTQFFSDEVILYAFLKGKGEAHAKVFLDGEKSEMKIHISKGIHKISDVFHIERPSSEKLILYFRVNGELAVNQILILGENPILIVRMKGGTFSFDGKELKKIEWRYGASSAPAVKKAVDVKRVGNFALLKLTALLNNNGIVGEREKGNFDNPDGVIGAAYSREELEKRMKNGYLYYEGVPFIVRENDSGNDNIVCFGQEIILKTPLKVNRIYILGSSDHGDYSSKMILKTKTGNLEMKLAFSDWCGSPVFEESVAVQIPYRYVASGERQFIKPKMFVQVLDLSGSELESIELPVQPTMHIFAITLEVR